ncbi:NADH-quinone oxidoreductase subunit C [Streptomyces sp. NPDC000931]|uniref:NADH-quinone oxidoreductase subunit C n=1 Tax=Streptomyces sp. NPDC000931 TaxID=3154372 RepID=UPI00332A3CFC
MTTVGWLPADAEELFGAGATAEESYGVLTVDVPPASWTTALEVARDRVGCTFFDWLSAVDEPGTGFRVTAHVAALAPVRRLLLRTTVPHEAPTLPSAVDVYAGAAWHERETHEMFGVDFTGHPGLDHLLLPDGFEGHPLRKDFVLAARVAKAWPGAKEPGESEHGGPKRRQMLPPGVPDPNEWGPLKGQLPPAPARPARGAGRTAAGATRAAGDRPRRTRTAAEGSASQPAAPETSTQPATPPRRTRTAAEGSASQPAAGSSAQPRRTRTAAEGSASQAAEAHPEPTAAPARRARSASEGSASQRSGAPAAGEPRRARTASEGSASRRAASKAPEPSDEPAATGDEPAPVPTEDHRGQKPPAAPRSPDAPWHHARPAFARPGTEAEAEGKPGAGPGRETRGDEAPDTGSEPEADSGPAPETGSKLEGGPTPDRGPDREAEAVPGAGSEPEGTGKSEPGPVREPAPGAGTAPEPRSEPEGGPETPAPEDPSGGPR